MLFRTTKEIGNFGERIAANYLRLHGYTVKERNYRYKKAELDIIATTWREIVFVEVKTRTYAKDMIEHLPPPGTAVHYEKQRLTRMAANAYLAKHPTKKQPRMDVIEIWLEAAPEGTRPKLLKLNHMKAAY